MCGSREEQTKNPDSLRDRLRVSAAHPPRVVARSPGRATASTSGLQDSEETCGRWPWHGRETVPQPGRPGHNRLGAGTWEMDLEDGPLAQLARRTDGPVHRLDQVLDDRQPQASAADGSRTGLVDAIEP